ncbi:MAG TPA: ATP synthase F1 subunit delta, partial [Armatimonadetes bacterium]|nr:ATP synthase F1 subunit delta [Armatimonadota bacterium]
QAADRDSLRDALGEQLEVLQTLLGASPKVRRLLGHPSLSLERKFDALAKLLGEAPVEPLKRLIALLIENDRLEVLETGADVYQQLADEAEGVMRAFVMSARPLTDDQSERLATALSAWLGESVVVDAVVDPDLLGGIAVRVGDRVLDASLRARLERIRERMVER